MNVAEIELAIKNIRGQFGPHPSGIVTATKYTEQDWVRIGILAGLRWSLLSREQADSDPTCLMRFVEQELSGVMTDRMKFVDKPKQ